MTGPVPAGRKGRGRRPPAPPLQVTATVLPGATVVRLAGEADHVQCRTLEIEFAKVMEGRPARLVVDLSRVTFCDTAGLNSLLRMRGTTETECRLVLAAPSRPVRSLLAVTGTDRVFTISPSIRAALAVPEADPEACGASDG
ncbi:STAS domain-containing protein [Kitasatospora terrestris]|uniref:STAS domain-containing protein n=1 Tax=Kitasatospora terrestris TaxID=258051 RepID=A0ABP9ENZ1_9ACTN